MDWIESIKTIKKAQENNQLIVFVGAGVSKNSNVPTWWELIKIIADKIGYDRCDFCKKRKDAYKIRLFQIFLVTVCPPIPAAFFHA